MRTAHAAHGMVSAPHALAAQSGARILAAGGNAIEAALAVAASLSVVYPHMTGLGGDSFWLIAAPGEAPITIDGAGRSGAAVDVGYYRDRGCREIPWRGAMAANTVAGAVSAWAAAREISRQWRGRLPLGRLFAEAISLAEHGTVVSSSHGEAALRLRSVLEPVPGLFAPCTNIDGAPPAVGALLRQPALARTLEVLARDGLESFYTGALAAQIAAELGAAGAPLSAADLAGQRATLGSSLRLVLPVADVFNCGPPSQGLASLLILGLFSRLPTSQPDSFAHVHGIVESTKLAFAVRDREVGHRAADGSGLEHYLKAAALDHMAARIDRHRAAPWHAGAGDGDTVWFGVIDAEGRAVSALQSLYFEFGSAVGLPQSGFVWQNRGCAFRLGGSGPNVLAPRVKPFHTLNPGLCALRRRAHHGVRRDGRRRATADSGRSVHALCALRRGPAGGHFGPRWLLGRSWGDSSSALRLESRFPEALIEELIEAGHPAERVAAFDQLMGHAGAVVHSTTQGFTGASDPRSDRCRHRLLSANSGRSHPIPHVRSAASSHAAPRGPLHDAGAQRLSAGFFSTIPALVAGATHSARHLH